MKLSRKTIALTPVLLVLGIVAQAFMLALIIVLYIPCLIWPEILNHPYLWITRGMARIMAKSIMGHKRESATLVQAE